MQKFIPKFIREKIIENEAIEWNLKHNVENPYGSPFPYKSIRNEICGDPRVLQLAKWNDICQACGRAARNLDGPLKCCICGRQVFK